MSDEPTTPIEEPKDEQQLAATPPPSQNALSTHVDVDDDGFEDLDARDMTIPFVSLLQSNSPQCKKKNDKRIDGAEAGFIHNTVDDRIWDGDQGLVFVPAYIEKALVEWRPRGEDGSGGGFAGRHPWDGGIHQKMRSSGLGPKDWKTTEGNNLRETYYVWGFIVDPDNLPETVEDCIDYAIVAFDRTKISVWRKYVTKLRQMMEPLDSGGKRKVPLWRNLIRIKSSYVPNGDNDYYNFDLTPARGSRLESLLDDDSVVVEAAQAFRAAIKGGAAKANTDAFESATGGDADGDDVPF